MPYKHAPRSTIQIGHTLAFAPDDSSTYYFMDLLGSALKDVPLYRKLILPFDYRITGCAMYESATVASSNEAWPLYIRLNNTTDYLVASLSNTDAIKWWINTNMNIPVKSTDFIEMKFVTPAWVTNPTNQKGIGYLTIEIA
ncbi:MAG: hypothetical protein IMZ49_00400 [Actinobacteria bacterium]|nr:hypothetical protein [Actinomycetota bacterium]MBE3126977.1 hypothetical protein [Candidatus Atribacteria bacterium]